MLFIMSTSHADKPMTYFNELCTVLDRHAPLRERRVTDRPSAPWISEDVKSAKAEKRRAERQWRKTGLPEDKFVFCISL